MSFFIDENDDIRPVRVLLTVFGVIFGLMLLFGSAYTIPSGFTGVVKTFGEASEVPSGPGLHFKIPLVQSVTKMSVQTEKYVAPASAASKDLQVVSTAVAINYRLSPESTPIIYTELSLDFENRIIQPIVQETVKSVTSKYTAEELITKRSSVKEDIASQLRTALSSRMMIVEEVSITDFDFSAEFNRAIESKVTAEQLKLKAERDLERIEVEAKQKIASAQAEAESLRLQKQEVTDELIRLREIEAQLKAIEKWNGIMPQVTGGVVPFINVG